MSKENGKGKPKDVLSPKELEKQINKVFNKKAEDFDEIELSKDDFKILDGKYEITNKSIVQLIKTALQENRTVKINSKENVVFIKK